MSGVDNFQILNTFWGSPFLLSSEMPLNKQNIIYIAPKRDKQIRLSANPYFEERVVDVSIKTFSNLYHVLGMPLPH